MVKTAMTRTERRRLATHEDLLVATRELLLERGPRDINARLIAKRADHASATFYNHFADVAAAIDEAMEPTAVWARDWAQRIVSAEDFPVAIAEFVAEYLVRLEEDGTEWAVAHAANRRVLNDGDLEDIAAAMRENHLHSMEDRGVPAGHAGAMALNIMASCGDLYGGRPLSRPVRRRIARMLHAAHFGDADMVATQAELSLDLVEEREAA